MVHKSSLFEKFISRWRSPSGVKIERPDAGAATAAENRTEDAGPPLERMRPPAEIQPELAHGRKLSAKEEAALALGEGFKELSSLMRGVAVRLEDQGGHSAAMAHDLQQLPALGQAQLEAMRQLATLLDRQGEQNALVLRTLGELPAAVSGLQQALDRAATSDARTANTLTEFREHMHQIQGSMREMVGHSREHADSAQTLVREQNTQTLRLAETMAKEGGKHVEAVREAVGGLERSHQETSRRLEEQSERGIENLRAAHEDQSNRLHKMVHESAKWNRAVLVLLIMVFAALASIFVALLYR